MFKKNFCLSVLLLFLSLGVYAQKYLKNAAVIFNNSNDTAKGFIDYKEWLTNPSSILFSTDKNASLRRMGTGDITYFEVIGQDERYRKYTVKISMDKVATADLGDKDTSSETKEVFLKILVTGKNVSLYYYRDGLKTRYYLQDGIGTPLELLNSTYLENVQVKQERQYRQSLQKVAAKYLPGQNDIFFDIDAAGYYTSDIKAICLKINGDNNAGKTIVNYKRRGLALFAGVGINQAKTRISNAFFNDKDAKAYTLPVVTLGADIAFKPETGKLIMRAQLHATTYKAETHAFRDYTQYTEQYDYKFRQVNISFDPQILYYLYNQNQVRWFVSAGFSLNFSSYPDNQIHFARKSSASSSESTTDDYVHPLRSFWMTECVATGVNINRFQLELAYFARASVAQTAAASINNTSLQLHLNYFLKQ